uniref:3-hydroxyisobutyryl-CoA hydrolase n=1 Tax=Solanum tuberosum TaxID=4113 RepID=M1CFJ1_SOLTU
MATYSKTQVSILDGIVMGGGAGASIHGRFRVATEKSVFAMPETDLGHFPDVGASYFLSRLPGFFGEYAGLTGSRLDGAEMLACGLATHFVSSDVYYLNFQLALPIYNCFCRKSIRFLLLLCVNWSVCYHNDNTDMPLYM